MLEGMTEARSPLDVRAVSDPGRSKSQICTVPCELAHASSRGLTPSALKARQLILA